MSTRTQKVGSTASGTDRLRAKLEQARVASRSLGWYISGWRLGFIFLVLALVFPQIMGWVTADNAQTFIADAVAIGIYVMLALGLNIVVGYAGLLDLGYVAFFVIGSYTVAAGTNGNLQNPAGTHTFATPVFSFWWLLPAGALLAGVFGILLGAPTLRLRGDYLAIVTLGFGEILPFVFMNQNVFFGQTGISAMPPADINTPLGAITFSNPLDSTPWYYLTLFLVLIVLFAAMALRDSSLGRAWIAIREDETAAATSGVNLVRTKLLAFGLGATIGGIAGVINGSFYGAIEPDQFNFAISITVLVMIVLGGLGSIPGVILGAVILRFFDVYLLSTIGHAIQSSTLVAPDGSPLHILAQVNFDQTKLLFYGIILVVMILLRPQGLIPNVRRQRELRGIGAAPEGASAVGLLERSEAGERISGAGAEDETTYAGAGTDDQGREG